MIPEYFQLHQKYNKDILQINYINLNIEDYIIILIWKQRLFQYPTGYYFIDKYKTLL